jgi:hypothetical protein
LHELSNPGLHLGAEYVLAATSHFQSLAASSFQAYNQQGVETGYALHVRWGQRYTFGFGLTCESLLGIGAAYTRYSTTIFNFQDSIAVATAHSAARVALSPHMVFGPGYDFERVLGVPLQLYARLGVALVFPDLNATFQASAIAELGLRWTPGL